jgi:hypothetical protein
MTPKLIKRLMERQWRHEPCSDPLRVACWEIDKRAKPVLQKKDRKLVKLLPDDDGLVADHDDSGPS